MVATAEPEDAIEVGDFALLVKSYWLIGEARQSLAVNDYQLIVIGSEPGSRNGVTTEN